MLRFTNPGEIDPRLIMTLGVNVKESASPIGYFGTGLKYAIAGVLRSGGRVEIHSGEQTYRFTCENVAIRGKDFQFIRMNDTQLGFTTDLGRNWEPWMWYREIASNTMDEGGTIGVVNEVGPPKAGETNIYVTGLDDEHAKRGQIFISGEPLFSDPDYAEIYPATTGANQLFYRGVRVGSPEKPAMFRYNIKTEVTLTEDRTLASLWDARYYIGRAVNHLTDVAMLEEILLASEWLFESTFDFNNSVENPILDEVIERLMEDQLGRLNQSAVKRVKTKRESAGPKASKMTQHEESMLASAREFLSERLGVNITTKIHVTESLGTRTHGVAWDTEIYVSRLAFEEGVDHLIAVLMEEWLHAERHLGDYTREMQTWLLNKIVSTGRGSTAEALPRRSSQLDLYTLAAAAAQINLLGTISDDMPF